jgi:hypothetical protein
MTRKTQTTPTLTEIQAKAAAIEAGKTVKPIEYMSPDMCAVRVVAMPFGGSDAPSHAVFELVQTDYDDDGTVTGERTVDTLKTDGRGVLVAWSSVATKSSRTTNRVDTAIRAQWGRKLRDGYGLPDAARLPLEVAAALQSTRYFVARCRCLMPSEVDVADVVKTARISHTHLAGYISDDGTYRPPLTEAEEAEKAKAEKAEAKAKKAAAKKAAK